MSNNKVRQRIVAEYEAKVRKYHEENAQKDLISWYPESVQEIIDDLEALTKMYKVLVEEQHEIAKDYRVSESGEKDFGYECRMCGTRLYSD